VDPHLEREIRPRQRPRRLRRTEAIRALVRETALAPEHLVLPQFVAEGRGVEIPIEALPGRSRLSIDCTIEECRAAMESGVRAFALFPVIDPKRKSPDGAEGLRPDNLLCRAVEAIKSRLPEACVITDVALDPYSSHGHDGLVGDDGSILNDETLSVLAEMAALHAAAGADVVAPSDMMDGRVAAIREALESAGHDQTIILAYCAKYASGFYGPFRQALDSAPVAAPGIPGDKKTYQMDPANAREAFVEAALDLAEGADILMVKPALPNLDVIARLRPRVDRPLAAYQVSGEYAMIKAAAARGWLDERQCMVESLVAIRRAGADLILSYAALDYARWWRAEAR
jgi:porphobilinogen synthase